MSEQTRPSGELLAEISNAIVGIFRECYGRGPTKVKTYMFDDYVFTVEEDILTPVERTLVEDGHEDLVRTVRLTFQEAVAERFVQAISDAVGRRVIS